MKFIIPLTLIIVGTISNIQPVYTFDGQYLEPLEGILGAVSSEAKGIYNWAKNSTTIIDRDERIANHRTAGIIMWLWYNLNTSLPVNSLLINVIKNITAENFNIDWSQYMLPTTLASIIHKMKVKFDIDNAIIKKSMLTMEHFMDSRIDPKIDYYLTTDLMNKWPYWEQNPSPNHKLHLKFLYLAGERFNNTCFSVLRSTQVAIQTILHLGCNSQISDQITSIYYQKQYVIQFYIKEKILANLSTDPVCSQLPNRTINSDLFFLVSNVRAALLTDSQFEGKWEDEYDKIIKNPDSGYPD